MKSILYITGIIFTALSCTTTRNLSSTIEDDIYYVPGQKALVVKEVEDLTGQQLNDEYATVDYASESYSRDNGSSIPPASFQSNSAPRVNARTGQLDQVDMQNLSNQALEILATDGAANTTLYENTGYWIGGYKGNDNDLAEIQRIINMYPQGFAYFNSNGQDIALNLAFDPDWNVYTDNGRYWWFPSNTNIDLYSSLLFGTYPKHIWTVIWDSPGYDSWAFDAGFNRGFNWGINVGWGTPGWSLGLGWNSGWYNPWYNYYGWYDPWYRPWGGGYYPGWGYPHWHNPHWNHPHWNHPNWGGGNLHPNYRPGTGLRPNNGGGVVSGMRPNRPGNSTINRPGVVRPNNNNSGSMIRPGSSTRPNSVTRPNTSVTRPSSVTRPGSTTRPSSVTRPGSTTRPSSVTRPGSTTRPSSVTRPTTTRPSNTRNTYTRPSTRSSSGSTVRRPTRPQSNYRPTYNNNSSSRYNSGSNSGYRPSQNSGSSYSPTRSGNTTRPTTPVNRPTRR